MEVLLCEFDLSHIKVSNPGYLITPMDDGRCFPLSLGQDYVGEVLARGDDRDSLEVVLVRHDYQHLKSAPGRPL